MHAAIRYWLQQNISFIFTKKKGRLLDLYVFTITMLRVAYKSPYLQLLHLSLSLSLFFFLLDSFYWSMHCTWAYRCVAYEIPFICSFVWSPLSLALVCFVGQVGEKEKKDKAFAFKTQVDKLAVLQLFCSCSRLVCCDSISGLIRSCTWAQKICAGFLFLLNQKCSLLCFIYLFIYYTVGLVVWTMSIHQISVGAYRGKRYCSGRNQLWRNMDPNQRDVD